MADSLERSNLTTEPNPTRRRPYVCHRCSKRFPSTHALGGHQNAHKHERSEERRLHYQQEKLLALVPYQPSPLPISNIVQPQPDGIGSTNLAPLAMLLTHSAMLVQPLATGFIYGSPHGHVFVPAAGPGGVPYKGPHQQNQKVNFPYSMNRVSTKPMPSVKYYYLHDDQERSGGSSTDAAAGPSNSTVDHQALINYIGADDDQNASEEEELDLALRL